ncbi:MAG: hypothetical protein GTN76_09370, partial [Candidatus Aenigmarchaeota archaeon]|nr:hypothetical protein [Candidatus Aenigmarchaeota archaeon]
MIEEEEWSKFQAKIQKYTTKDVQEQGHIVIRVLEFLKSPSPKVRFEAVKTFQKVMEGIRNPMQAMDLFRKALQNEDPTVRRRVIEAIVDVGLKVEDPKLMVEVVLEALKDDTDTVSDEAEAFIKMISGLQKVSPVIPLLQAALNDEIWRVRVTAARALVARSDEVEDLEPVVTVLVDEIEKAENDFVDPELIALMAIAGKLEDPSALVPALQKSMYGDTEEYFRGEVVNNTIMVTWIASDPNDSPDTLSFNLFYVNKETWVPIAEGLNTTQFVWDTTGAPDLDWTVLRVQASDLGNLTAIDDSDAGFQISNISPSSVKVQPRGYLLLRKLLFFVVIPGLVLYVASMVVYGRHAAKKDPQRANELKKNIQELETWLQQIEQRQQKIRAKGHLKKWPKKLAAMETRLVSLRAQNIASIKKYMALKTLYNTLQVEINDHLQFIGHQVTLLLEILEE